MARKPKNDLVIFFRIAKALPWKVTVCLAPISYMLLHYLAASRLLLSRNETGQIGAIITSHIALSIFSIAQYLLPLILIGGAATNYWSAHKRKINYESTLANGRRSDLLNMSWREFEGLVAEYFRREGFDVKLIGGNGPDGGVDVELRKGAEFWLVQCKQWRATKVGVDVVRELYGVMAARGATGAYVVTSASFTKDAQGFVNGRNIHLISGNNLIDQLKINSSLKDDASTPDCPTCRTKMIVKVARHGANTGKRFWACPRFPDCRATRSMLD
jgi:restriction system protein